MINSLNRYGMLVAAISLALVLTGCISPAGREAMTPQGVVVSKHYPYSLRVQTSDASEIAATGTKGSDDIPDADLKAAIEHAVIQTKLFKNIVQDAGGDYELSVRVISISRGYGLTFTVEMETAWSLIKAADRSVVMRNSVKSIGMATTGDSLMGLTQRRLAFENAARENISQGLKAVAELNL